MKKLIYIFLFVQIFTNAFAVSSIVTMALGMSIFLFGLGVIRGDHLIRFNEPIYLALFFSILIFGYLFFATGEKKTNHLLMWMVPVICYYYMFKRQVYCLFSLEEIKVRVLKVVTVATLFACLFAIFEFVSVNLLGFDLSFIPRGSVENYDPLSFDNIRARSFMEESGQYSFFWELFAPISVYWIKNNISSKTCRFLSYFVLIAGLLTSFSAVGFVCIVLWGISLTVYNLKNAGNVNKLILVLFGIVSFILLLLILMPELVELIFNVISNKLDPDNGSHSDRASRFEALEKLPYSLYLTGLGPNAAGTLDVDSFVSFYLGAFMSTGVLGVIFLFLFFLRQFMYVIKLKDKDLRFAFFLSLWFSIMHLMFVDIIYVPWLWVMLSLLCVIHFKEKEFKLKCSK